MPVYTSSIEVTADYPTIKPSLNLNFARSRSLDPRITFTRASTATYIGRDGLVKYAGEDEPRFDHDPDTLESLGLLIEESRTNLITRSTATGATNGVIGSGGALPSGWAIDQAQPGTTIEIVGSGTERGLTYVDIRFYGTTATTNRTLIRPGNTISMSGETYYCTAYSKLVSGTNNLSHTNFDTGALSLTSELKRNTGGIRTGLNGTLFPRFDIGLNATGQSYDLTIRFAAPQYELGSFPTSYIPTSGSAVTRAADRARITGTSFSDFFNTTEGTLVVQGRTAAGNSLNYTNQPIISIHNGSTTNRIIMFDRDGGTLEWNVIDGSFANGSGVLLDETTSYSGAADYIMCGTYKNGAPTRAVANGLGADGNTIESSGKNDTVNIFNQMDIGNELGTRQCSSPIKQVRYYPLSLSDAQIKSLVS